RRSTPRRTDRPMARRAGGTTAQTTGEDGPRLDQLLAQYPLVPVLVVARHLRHDELRSLIVHGHDSGEEPLGCLTPERDDVTVVVVDEHVAVLGRAVAEA